MRSRFWGALSPSPLFEVLLRRHNQRMYRTIRSVLRDPLECEDALQQAWLSAYTHLDQFAGAAALSTWLVRIALHEALAHARHLRRLSAFEGRPGDGAQVHTPGPSPETRAAELELARLVEAVDRLPDLYRTVFILREVDQMATADVAQALGVSGEVVKTRLHRARQSLRTLLDDHLDAATQAAYRFLGLACARPGALVMASILRPPAGTPGGLAGAMRAPQRSGR